MRLSRRQFLWLASLMSGAAVACSTRLDASSPTEPSDTPLASATPTDAIANPADPAEIEGLPNPPRGDVRLLVISDLNGIYGSTTYDPEVIHGISLLPAFRPDLVIGGGDMIAGQDVNFNRDQIQAMWNGFDQYIGAPLRQAGLPFGFTIGNHDASRATRGSEFIYQLEREMASAYWNDPAHNPGLQFIDRARFPYYYTFQAKDVFFLVWDASSGLRMPPNDRAWVEQSLASDAAQSAKLRMIIGHLPLYAVAITRDRVGEVLTDALELHQLMRQYNVHTYISGHHHAYYPAEMGNVEFLHAGALGGGPRKLLSGDLPPRKTMTVVDITFDPVATTYTTYDMQAMQLIDPQELPRTLSSQVGMVIRRDLDWQALTPDEQQACLQHLSATLCQT